MSRSSIYTVEDVRYQRIPTTELAADELREVRSLRIAAYASVFKGVRAERVEDYVDQSMATWVNANNAVGVDLRANQSFQNTVVWLARSRRQDKLIGEVLSADNVSSRTGGLLGRVERAVKAHAPISGKVHTAVREVYGPEEVAAAMMHPTLKQGRKSAYAYVFEDENNSPEIHESWGFETVAVTNKQPLGPEGPVTVEHTLHTEDADDVALRLFANYSSVMKLAIQIALDEVGYTNRS